MSLSTVLFAVSCMQMLLSILNFPFFHVILTGMAEDPRDAGRLIFMFLERNRSSINL